MDLQHYLTQLETVVNIDSGTTHTAGVAAVVAFMQSLYQQEGWFCEQVDLGEQVGPGLFACNKPQAERFDVLFIGHTDTVFPQGTTTERPFKIEAGRAYGPGVSDMKGGLLALFWVIKGLEKSVTDRLSIGIAMNPDEETGSVYSEKWLTQLALRSRNVFVAEPGRPDGSFVKARKGVSSYYIQLHGVASHAGNDPERGRSATLGLAHLMLKINQLANPALGTTLNFGTIEGGIASNVVADYAQAALDLRYWSNEEYLRVNQAITALCSEEPLAGVTVTYRQEAYKPAMAPSPETELLMALVEETGRELGLTVNWKAAGGGSDANLTASLGIPSLDAFGPCGGGFHSKEEYLEIDSILPRIALLQRILQKLCDIKAVAM